MMNYFKYLSLILVTIWVVFYSDSKAEDISKNVYLNSLQSYNQSRMKYFQINAELKKNNEDIQFYRSRRLEAMSAGDFNSEKYKRTSEIIDSKIKSNQALALKKSSLQYNQFNIKSEEYFKNK